MPRTKIRNKIVLITGGASDIGKSIALELLHNDNTVILWDINESGLNAFKESTLTPRSTLITQKVDMTISEEVKQAFEKISSQYKQIDYVFNIVGYGLVGEVKDMSIQDWTQIIDTNIYGVLYPTIFAYELMTKQGSGHIVNMSSLGGLIPSPFNTAYSTTKHAIVGLSSSLREEGKARGVKVTVLCPGGIRTKLWDSVRLINLQRDLFKKLVPEKTLQLPNEAAKIILLNVERNKGIVIFPAFATVSNIVYRFFPMIFRKGIQMSVKSLRAIREESS